MAKQGKCTKCKVRYVFKKSIQYKVRLNKPPGINCRNCGNRLVSTNHLSHLPVKDWGTGKPVTREEEEKYY